MLAALTSRLDGMTDGDRYYDSVHRAKERLTEYVNGTFSLFNHRHDTPRQAHSVEISPKPEPALQEAAPTMEAGSTHTDFHSTRLTIDGRRLKWTV